MDNAAVRLNFASEIYAAGVNAAKEEILRTLPEQFAKRHREGDLHLHDLESYGKLYNCCTPDWYACLRSQSYVSVTECGLIHEIFEKIENLVTRLAVVQAGGIGFGNLDIDLEKLFDELKLSCTEENVIQLEEAVARFISWINTTRTRFCRENYYLTVNLGLATGFWGRAFSKAMIEQFRNSPVGYTRPNIVFKVCAAINSSPRSVNYDIFQCALTCTAKRMIPTYLLMDSEVNRSCDPSLLNIMGCRTRVYDNINGPQGTIGRGNLAYTTINLPRAALVSKDMDGFFRRLRELMKDCCEVMEIRNDWLRKTGGKYVEPALQGNIWKGVSTIDEMLKQGTRSIGFIGLSETVEILGDRKMFETEQAKSLAHTILSYMQDYVMEKRLETGENYSLLATPGELVSGRFCELDRKFYPHVVQEKGFYTNSFHVDVDSSVSVFEKLAFEGAFHKYCSGGSITYVEFSSAPLNNIEAVSDAIAFAEKSGVSYLGINFPLDICKKCGKHGTFDRCSYCGSDDVLRIRRVSGYLEDTNFFTSGKRAEVKRRKANMQI